jgi:hypothetical protein
LIAISFDSGRLRKASRDSLGPYEISKLGAPCPRKN